MAGHTPGPWFVSGVRATIDRQAWLRVLQETPERELAFIPYSDRTDALHIEAHANARLAAAAPDLLDALKYILDRRGQEMMHAHFVGGNTEGCARCVADAAIAKAEGNSPSIAALIERLETLGAEEPCRALADDVLLACGWTKECHGFININGSTEEAEIWLRPGEKYTATNFEWLADLIIANNWPSEDIIRPNPLSSIDAALQLVPETPHIASLKMERNTADFGNAWHVSYRHQYFGHHAVLPIAIVISALRARAALKATP